MDPEGMSEKEWHEVIDAMEEVAPYYERVNRLITFGMVDRWRKAVAELAGKDDIVLELGSGPGNFTRHLVSERIFCVEPSKELLKLSRDSVDTDRVTLLRGVGEQVPLADESVDKVFCVFSFRDFYDRGASASEMNRVLKEEGEAMIVDIAKPPPGPLAKLLEMHVRHMVPPLARIGAPSAASQRLMRNPYATFVETYRAFGFTKLYEELLQASGFTDVSTKYLELRGATITRGKKPCKKSTS
jgi:demethylmenaquinone methyltransferase/2-methoxy-6-polyprenyl-1,4-benzoquinol methylase